MSNYLKEQLEKLSEEEKEKLITTVSFIDYDELYKKTMDSDNPTAFLLDERINYNTYLEKDRNRRHLEKSMKSILFILTNLV